MFNKIITEDSINKVKIAILNSSRIVIVTHVFPDGDAIGSSLALYHFLIKLNKSVNVIVPNNFPVFLEWMNGAKNIIIGNKEEFIAHKFIQLADLIFCLDFNNFQRIKQLHFYIQQSKAKKILIDHHPLLEHICDIIISYPTVSSTSELVFILIHQIGMSRYIDRNFAECIYTGMMTDTGAFTYNSNKVQIYFTIKELLKEGINKDVIYDNVYNNYSESRIRLQGYILYKKMKIIWEYRTSLITLSNEEQQKFSLKNGDTEGLVNIPLSIKKIIFSVFIREADDCVKISFRSKGKFPTNKFAFEVFNGGGHSNASGGEFNGKIEDAAILVEKMLPTYRHLLTN
ncbi:MAG: DHH family phosphoesterase [Bacteroidales bacterium OttesenSCG-928-I14]|jgi:phosphoesterase RecJ-like protein|nr:DHH family phosphoesterase [Bacteroidales bacterium OttesenSCG-928-I14]